MAAKKNDNANISASISVFHTDEKEHSGTLCVYAYRRLKDESSPSSDDEKASDVQVCDQVNIGASIAGKEKGSADPAISTDAFHTDEKEDSGTVCVYAYRRLKDESSSSSDDEEASEENDGASHQENVEGEAESGSPVNNFMEKGLHRRLNRNLSSNESSSGNNN